MQLNPGGDGLAVAMMAAKQEVQVHSRMEIFSSSFFPLIHFMNSFYFSLLSFYTPFLSSPFMLTLPLQYSSSYSYIYDLMYILTQIFQQKFIRKGLPVS